VRFARAISLFVAFFMLTGALGLRTPQECESDPAITRDSERMNCYYASALTAAYLCAPGNLCERAITLCEEIWVRFGAPINPDDARGDQRKKAELVTNQCYYEIAKITRSPETCGYITKRDDYGSQLFGDVVTKEACYNVTGNMAQIAPENYNETNPNNICSVVFLFPALMLGLILSQRP
jgi:hypothetical protein